MTEFSNLLRQRLATGPGARVRPDSHPDADTLTAYVERLLPATERSQVLQHLTACGHCREVMALSLPEPVANQEAAPATVPAGRRWGFLWNPRFRMAASLATVAIVAMVLLQVRQKPAERARTENVAPPASAGDSAGKKDTNTPALEASRPEAEAQPSARVEAGSALSSVNGATSNGRVSSVADNKAAPALTRSSVAANSTGPALMAKVVVPSRSDYVNQNFFVNNASSDDDAPGTVTGVATAGKELPSAPTPRTSSPFQPGMISASNNMIFADMPTQNQGTQTVRSIAPPSGSSRWFGTLSALAPKAKKALTTRRSPAIPPGAASTFAMGGVGQLHPKIQPSDIAAAAPMPETTKSELDTSYAFRSRARSDAGVAAKAEMRESTPSSWQVSGGRLLKPGDSGKWVEGCPGEAIEFAAVSAHGQDIWAGGGNAALVHSRDGGATCERLTLGASATGAIVRIEVRGANVQVKSSSGQSWSSQDGGKTWKIDE